MACDTDVIMLGYHCLWLQGTSDMLEPGDLDFEEGTAEEEPCLASTEVASGEAR